MAERGSAAVEWSGQLGAIGRIAARLTRLASLEDVGLAVCSETRQVIAYENCRVYVVEQNGVDITAVAMRSDVPMYTAANGRDLRCRVGEDGQGLVGLAAARGAAIISGDARRDPRHATTPPDGPDETSDEASDEAALHESMLLVPMHYESRVTGVIELTRRGLDQFHDDDLRLLQVLSDQAAVAVENARLLAGRDQLVAELAALLDISASSGLADDEQGLAAVLARKLRDASGVDGCVISRWEHGSTVLDSIGAADGGEVAPEYDLLDYPATRTVLREARPLTVQASAPGADRAEVAMLRDMQVQTLLMLPLVVGGRTIGLVELFARAPRTFSEHERDFCLTMANQAGAVLENARLVDQLRRAADVDQVTGVHNHRYLQERLQQELARAMRQRGPLSVLMIDLDGFKRVNDRHGHADGDRVLRAVSSGITSAVRTNDIVARYGGDEFVVLMPDTSEEHARIVAERIVSAIRARTHTASDGGSVTLGASAGLAVFPDDGRTAQTLLRAADAAMYAVKRAGGSAVRRVPVNRATPSGPRR